MMDLQIQMTIGIDFQIRLRRIPEIRLWRIRSEKSIPKLREGGYLLLCGFFTRTE
jgi:hypothetical protein